MLLVKQIERAAEQDSTNSDVCFDMPSGSMRGGGPGGPSARQRQVMEESFVMLGSASLLRPSSAGLEASTRGLQPQSFDQKFATLAATFEIASDATKVLAPSP